MELSSINRTLTALEMSRYGKTESKLLKKNWKLLLLTSQLLLWQEVRVLHQQKVVKHLQPKELSQRKPRKPPRPQAWTSPSL